MVAEDRSEPNLAVADEVKPDLVRVEVSVGDWKVLVDVACICAAAAALAMVIVGIVCNATALELAAEGE